MAPLTIGWEYLTGYSVATDPSTRDRAEWPPHPARVFMALAAAWFETEPSDNDDSATAEWTTEGAAMRWLERLGNPELLLPDVGRCSERSNVTVYVPINDKVGPSAATVQSCPAITRSKQPRSFPRIWVGSGACFLRWPSAEGKETHIAAIHRLCGKVTRLGHSSSLVSMWVSHDTDLPPETQTRLVRDDLQAELQVRAFSHGMLDMLGERFGEEPRRRYAALTAKIEGLKAEKQASTGKGAKERRGNIDKQVGKTSEVRSIIDRVTAAGQAGNRPLDGISPRRSRTSISRGSRKQVR